MTGTGFGRVLVLVYAVLAVAATARSVVQVFRDFAGAPLAYSLSVLAAVVYLVAAVALARGWRTVAWAAVGLEMIGVLAVGALSLARSDLFPDATVWSGFGAGYGWVPLVLPAVGLWWLGRTAAAREDPGR